MNISRARVNCWCDGYIRMDYVDRWLLIALREVSGKFHGTRGDQTEEDTREWKRVLSIERASRRRGLWCKSKALCISTHESNIYDGAILGEGICLATAAAAGTLTLEVRLWEWDIRDARNLTESHRERERHRRVAAADFASPSTDTVTASVFPTRDPELYTGWGKNYDQLRKFLFFKNKRNTSHWIWKFVM